MSAEGCEGCTLRLANGDEPFCDQTGTLRYYDGLGRERRRVCPAWPLGVDLPRALREASMPPAVADRLAGVVDDEVARRDRRHRRDLVVTVAVIVALLAAATVVGSMHPWAAGFRRG